MGRNAEDGPSGDVGAGDALSYAVSGDLLVCYGVIVVGWAMRALGAGITGAPGREVTPALRLLVGEPLSILGAAIVGVGSVAIAYKVLADAVSA